MAAACGIQTYQDLAGVIYRITGESGAELLFSATRGQDHDWNQAR